MLGWMQTRRGGDKETRRHNAQSPSLRVSLSPRLVQLAIAILLVTLVVRTTPAGDLGIVPLLDGERSDSLNLWGGPLNPGNTTSFVKEFSVVHSGTGAYQANLGSLPSGGFEFFQTFSSALTSSTDYRQDR